MFFFNLYGIHLSDGTKNCNVLVVSTKVGETIVEKENEEIPEVKTAAHPSPVSTIKDISEVEDDEENCDVNVASVEIGETIVGKEKEGNPVKTSVHPSLSSRIENTSEHFELGPFNSIGTTTYIPFRLIICFFAPRSSLYVDISKCF